MNKIIFAIIFLLAIVNFFSINTIYNSYVDQKFLMGAFYNKAENIPLEDIFSINTSFPNLSATSVPVEVLKAQILLNQKYYKDTVISMLDQGIKMNPYHQYPYAIKALYYANKNNLDSLEKYAKKSYYNMPDHKVHFNLYLDLLRFKKDTLELNKAFKYLKTPREEFAERYLSVLTNIKNNFSQSDENIADSLANLFSSNKYTEIYSKIFKVGKENVYQAFKIAKDAEKLFNNKKYEKAASLYERAFELNPIEKAYYENAANSHMQAGNDKKAIEILKEVISKLNPRTGKAEYLLGILYIGMKENQTGCEYLYESKNKGFTINPLIFSKFCNQEDTQ